MLSVCAHSSSLPGGGDLPRLLLILGLVAVVAAILLGYKFRVMMAGGRALLMLLIVAGLVWFALNLKRRGPRS
jgi:hypothetical protein